MGGFDLQVWVPLSDIEVTSPASSPGSKLGPRSPVHLARIIDPITERKAVSLVVGLISALESIAALEPVKAAMFRTLDSLISAAETGPEW